MIKEKGVIALELKENKIEFVLEELAPLLITNKTEGFRQIGEKILNAMSAEKLHWILIKQASIFDKNTMLFLSLPYPTLQKPVQTTGLKSPSGGCLRSG
jgi:hypothetical protein